MECAELVAIATETYVKNKLHEVYNRVRSNGPRYDNGAAEGIMTAKYRKRVTREETEHKAGKLLRDRDNDLLPTEAKEAEGRKPLGIGDLKLANMVGPSLWNGMPMIGANINHSIFDVDSDEGPSLRQSERHGSFARQINGHSNGVHDQDDAMDIDEDTTWEGTGAPQAAELRNTLASLLRMPA